MTSVLSILWGFSVGGVGKYAATLAGMDGVDGITLQTACICGESWNRDLTSLRELGALPLVIKGRSDFSWIPRCCDLIVKTRPNLVFVHGFNGPVVARICQHRLKGRVSFVCSYHGPYHPPRVTRRPLTPLFNRAAEYIYKHDALGIVAVTQHSKNYLVKKGVPDARVVVIHNGIPIARPIAEEHLTRDGVGLHEKDFVIGATSRFHSVKGLRYILEALPLIRRIIPKARVVLVGDGPCEPQLRSQHRELRLGESVLFAGCQSSVCSWLELFDLFVLPSLEECHSIGLLEAMRARLPIVATGVGGNPESIRHGVEGLLVPPMDSAALASTIIQLAGDPQLRRRFAEAAARRFKREFTSTRMLERTMAWLRSFESQSVSVGTV